VSEPVLEDCSPESRMDAMQQLAALQAAITAEQLRLIVVMDREQDWAIDGATGMAPWLVAATRCSSHTAHELVRAAGQLAVLPELHEALAEGALSWEQARPAATFATPATDELLARELPGCTVAQIQSLARQHKPRPSEADLEAARQRRFRWRADHVLGGFHYKGFLPTDRAELLNQVLTRMADTAGADPATGLWEPFPARCADALVELADLRAAIDPDPDTCLVVVHTDADVIDGHVDGNGTIGDIPVSDDSVLRLLCDCQVEFSIDRPDGTTIGIARAGRNVPRWLRRKVAHRDGTCRFPGCGRKIRHRHHMQHWTNQGPTDADNLIGLCWHHHVLVHEGGWRIHGHPDRDLEFTSPYGRHLTSKPKPVHPDVRTRARRAANLEPDLDDLDAESA
jgi:hypothetical protein